MTIDLWCLVATAVWGFVLVLFEVGAKTHWAGLSWNLGNREQTLQFPQWIQRTGRALANHKENLPLFLVAVLVLHISGRADSISAAAALGYVISRIVYSLIYIFGTTGIRTIAWGASQISVLIALTRLLG